MKNPLTNATKKKIIRLIKRILYSHPRYRSNSDNVSNKFSFENTPQMGVIVKSTSSDGVRLSADNYQSRQISFCMLVPYNNKPGTSIEWVRENFSALEQISNDRSIFPSPPGAYRINIEKVPDRSNNLPGIFRVKPIITIKNEPLIVFTSCSDYHAQLLNDNIYPYSTQFYLDGKVPLILGVDYSVDWDTGQVTFLQQTPVSSIVYADYRVNKPESPPIEFQFEESNVDAIPGVVLAFGDRAQENDEMLVVITEDRTDTADIYGGKYEVSFELTTFTKESEEREKFTDYLTTSLLSHQNSLGFEGLEIVNITPGSESEEIYNDETEEYFYEGTINATFRVDWEIYIPIPISVRDISFTSSKEDYEKGRLNGQYQQDNLGVRTTIGFKDPRILFKRKLTYERVI